MKKGKVLRNLLLAGTAFYAAAMAKLFHDTVVRKKQEETDLILRPDMVEGEARVKLWQESNRWLNERESEKVSIQSFDGLTLFGEFFEGDKNPEATIFMVHGYRSNRRREFAVMAKFYLEAGFHVLLVDDRAHGLSEGKYIGFGCLDKEDCYRWVHYLDERFEGKQSIFLHGVSMGAATVLMASNLNLPSSVKGIVADCGYTSPKAQFQAVLKAHGKGFLSGPVLWGTDFICRLVAGYGFSDSNSLISVADTKHPIFVIHGTKDDFVPTYMGKEIYKACASEKELWLTEGAGHAESYYLYKEEYERKVLSFFHRCMEGDFYEN